MATRSSIYVQPAALFVAVVAATSLQATSLRAQSASAPGGAAITSITPDSVELTAGAFRDALLRGDEPTGTAARLYLLGVEDATEGRAWCSYKAFKTITLREQVYESLQKLPPSRLSERAAVVIEEALHKRFPCEESRKR
jgi:Rap1a immunity proteins